MQIPTLYPTFSPSPLMKPLIPSHSHTAGICHELAWEAAYQRKATSTAEDARITVPGARAQPVGPPHKLAAAEAARNRPPPTHNDDNPVLEPKPPPVRRQQRPDSGRTARKLYRPAKEKAEERERRPPAGLAGPMRAVNPGTRVGGWVGLLAGEAGPAQHIARTVDDELVLPKLVGRNNAQVQGAPYDYDRRQQQQQANDGNAIHPPPRPTTSRSRTLTRARINDPNGLVRSGTAQLSDLKNIYISQQTSWRKYGGDTHQGRSSNRQPEPQWTETTHRSMPSYTYSGNTPSLFSIDPNASVSVLNAALPRAVVPETPSQNYSSGAGAHYQTQPQYALTNGTGNALYIANQHTHNRPHALLTSESPNLALQQMDTRKLLEEPYSPNLMRTSYQDAYGIFGGLEESIGQGGEAGGNKAWRRDASKSEKFMAAIPTWALAAPKHLLLSAGSDHLAAYATGISPKSHFTTRLHE
ncbi:uncharacterized protein EV422DRAFT_513689 [Fimicolochytrium jonesii]|uniref:uncharacterized protein n=1 Tax=Fimicolochytrium jonesii TaxID=1396493 RepID=UPI0022FEEB51|nr:uncharacterized protein EV422DRAFT_513689 [Fimicolochytrium jonesii]KAI8825646.1 hypothetical protein EV422DRAFT_513689 [Fimicolochytrium jonesii]